MYSEEFYQEQSAPAPKLGFHQLSRGVCRFGLVAGGSCALTLAARLIPALMPVAVITGGGIAIGSLIYALWRRGDQSLFLALGLLSALVGVALGGWDGIAIFMAVAETTTLIGMAAAVLAFVVVIAVERIFNARGQKQ